MHVCFGLLAPGVPGAVHLVGEAHDHGGAGLLDRRKHAGQLRDSIRRHRVEPALWLQGEEEGSPGVPDLARRGPKILLVRLLERKVDEGHSDGRTLADGSRELRQSLVGPVGIDTEQHTVIRKKS